MRTPTDWGQPCPNPECAHYSRMQPGNVSATATYLTQSGKRRLFRCHACKTSFSETRDTVFLDLRTSEEKVIFALKMLLVRVDLSGISFVLGVTEETVLEWLRRAALKAEQINAHLIICTIVFDESRMFDLLRLAKSTPAWQQIPFICARLRHHILDSPLALEGVAFTCQTLGAVAFLNVADYQVDPEQEMRDAIERLLDTTSRRDT